MTRGPTHFDPRSDSGPPLERELARHPRPPVRRHPPRRRGGAVWVIAAVVLVLGAAAAWFFLLRPATVVLEPPRGVDFGEQPLSSTGSPRSVTVASEGPRRLEVAAVEVAGEHAGDFAVVEDGCAGRSLARGERCAVTVVFQPQAEEGRRAVLVVASDGAGAPHGVALAGTGTQAVGSFVPPGLEFGELEVGRRTGPREMLLVNSGTAPLEVSEVRIGGERGSFRLAEDGCSGTTLDLAGDCTVEVAFAPRKEGALEAAVEVHSPGLDFPVTAPLAGTGTVPRLCLGAREMDFGPQQLGTAGRRSLTVSSCGTAPLEVEGVTPPAAAAGFAVTGEDCSGRTLAPRASCTVTLRFQPAAEGPAEAALGVTAAAGGSPWRVALTGTGTAPHAAARPEGLDFGGRRVETPGDLLQLSVVSTGTAPLRLGHLALAPEEGYFAITADGCSGRTLAPEESCEIAVAFRPRREGGYRGEIVIPTDAPEGPLEIALAGAGTAPHVAADPEALRFGEQRVGAASDIARLRVANPGTAPLQLGGLGIPGSAAFFIDADRCSGQAVPPGGRCEIGVRFEPPGEGPHQAELRIASDAREGMLRVRLAGTGVVPRAALSPEAVELGGRAGDFGPRRVTVENVGGAALRLDRLVVDGEEASFPVDVGDCTGETLPPGGSCRIEVRFAPVRPGRHEATLTLVHDGEGARRFPLVGDAAPPPPPQGLEPGSADSAAPQPVEGCEPLALVWEPVTRAWPPVSYDLEIQEVSRTGEWTALYSATTPGTEEALAEPLPKRRTYRWRVLARDGVGNRGEPAPWRYFVCVSRLE